MGAAWESAVAYPETRREDSRDWFMSLNKLVNIIHSDDSKGWKIRNTEAFNDLFGVPGGRFPTVARGDVQLRANEIDIEANVPYAAYIEKNNPTSGQYSGLSFVIFPTPSHEGAVPLGLVRSLAYFSPVIDEVLESNVSSQYFDYIRHRLKRSTSSSSQQ